MKSHIYYYLKTGNTGVIIFCDRGSPSEFTQLRDYMIKSEFIGMMPKDVKEIVENYLNENTLPFNAEVGINGIAFYRKGE